VESAIFVSINKLSGLIKETFSRVLNFKESSKKIPSKTCKQLKIFVHTLGENELFSQQDGFCKQLEIHKNSSSEQK